MDVLKRCVLVMAVLGLTGCQLTYIAKSAQSHFSILWNRVPMKEALLDPRLSPEQKEKLLRAEEARKFAVERMRLQPGRNYTRFSYLDRPYVTYVVSAAPRWKLEHHEWNYPVVGKMPYKGYAEEADAKVEERELQEKGLDTFFRGVSAYSTLGWFEDPVLSTMLSYKEHRLVDLIIHETTHATLYIKNSADFNERLAVFIGNKGTEQFYLEKEGPSSPTLARIQSEIHDDTLFSAFIGPQIESLRKWYEDLPATERRDELRTHRLKEIQASFTETVAPRMKTDQYKRFPEIPLNNARLMYFRTYLQDLKDFETLFKNTKGSWKDFLRCARTLEGHEQPEVALKELILLLNADPPKLATLCP